MITEERINSAAETILRAASIAITKGILRTIAAEAQEEGRKEGIEETIRAARMLANGYVVLLPRLEEVAERINEQG